MKNKKVERALVFVMLCLSGGWTALMINDLGLQGLSLSEFSFINYGKVVPPAVVSILFFIKYSKYLKQDKV